MTSSAGQSSVTKKRKPTAAARAKRPAARLAIDIELCKGCAFCVEFCPTGALELSSEFNRKGYHPPVVIEDDCVYCEVCELVCPEFAIYCVDEASVPGDGAASRAAPEQSAASAAGDDTNSSKAGG
jgi:2-oxoglutarate ferredoxin oxidoreductase subunit delta